MSLQNTKDLLIDANKYKYAVPAFNVENMEMIQAVVKAADELKSPVIIQTTPGTLRYSSIDMHRAMVEIASKEVSIPVSIHLDHGDSFELCTAAIESGYTSVMIDGSKLSFEENIKLTKSVVKIANIKSVTVEGELGTIGGKEDNIISEGNDVFTQPLQAKEFAERTSIDSIAIAIGTAHGLYTGTPKLDFQRLKEISQIVDIPLVLHGASGLADKDIKEVVKLGINKINFATELRIAYTKAIRQVLEEDPNVYDPKKYGVIARQAVEDIAKQKIKICNSIGKV